MTLVHQCLLEILREQIANDYCTFIRAKLRNCWGTAQTLLTQVFLTQEFLTQVGLDDHSHIEHRSKRSYEGNQTVQPPTTRGMSDLGFVDAFKSYKATKLTLELMQVSLDKQARVYKQECPS